MCDYQKTDERPRTKKQEEQVLRLLAAGKSEGEIAAEVWLSRFTVRWLAKHRKGARTE